MRYSLLFVVLLSTSIGSVAAAATAPDGAVVFETHCTGCHSIGGGDRVGPDLAGVSRRREADWLRQMIRDPSAMIAKGDPVVTQLVDRYNRIVMPNLGLDEAKTEALLAYLSERDARGTEAVPAVAPAVVYDTPAMLQPQLRVWRVFLSISAAIVLVFGVVAFSTRRPREVDTARAYGVRRVLFLVALVAVVGVLAMTLPDAPYAAQNDTVNDAVDRVIYVTGRQFEFIWSDEPIASREDIERVPRLRDVVLDRDSTVEFRVSSLDVNHGFGLYGPERQLVAQTQAMPGYVNRLRVHLDEPGSYIVLCLEYCAAGHHRMRSSLTVR